MLKVFAQSRDEELSVEELISPDDEVWTEADMDDPVIVEAIRAQAGAEPVEEEDDISEAPKAMTLSETREALVRCKLFLGETG